MSGNETQQVNAIDVLLQNADGDVLLPYTGYDLEKMADTDLSNLSNTGQAILDNLASINLSNLSSAGQAILDKKVEVEALLQQNGYAKFTWKDDNGISRQLCFDWGTYQNSSTKIEGSDYKNITVTCPSTINTFLEVICSRNAGLHMSRYGGTSTQTTVRIRNLISSQQTGYGVNIIRVGF